MNLTASYAFNPFIAETEMVGRTNATNMIYPICASDSEEQIAGNSTAISQILKLHLL